MALINCPECHASVSSFAAACPHCGYPLQINGNSARDDEDKAAFDLANIKIGSTIQFGHYPQNADGRDNTPIDWQVLDVTDGRALLISKYALDNREYNENPENITWEKSTLRTWLNKDFLTYAFSPAEQQRIPTVAVTADKNQEYRTQPGKSTQDKVFLLSIPEVEECMPSDKERLWQTTPYAVEQGAYTDDSAPHCWWWLRSPGRNQNHAAFVWDFGSVSYNGDGVDDVYGCVRPALWINL